jgi:hypothetical protein
MRRPQITLRALLVAMLIVGVFFGGMVVQRELTRRDMARQKAENEAALRIKLEKARLTLKRW